MGFSRSAGGGYPDLPARIVDIGLDYVEYENNSQHRIVVVYRPLEDESLLSCQTNMLNTSNELVTGGKEQTITIGSTENSFELEIVGDIVVSGKIGGKAKVWLDALENVGYNMEDLEESGDLSLLKGVDAEWKQMTYSEAVGRKPNPDFAEKPFWMPVKLLKVPTKQKKLIETVLEVVEGKNEDKMIAWSKDTGNRAANVLSEIDKAIREGKIIEVDDEYRVCKDD